MLYRGWSLTGVNPRIMPIPRDFLSGHVFVLGPCMLKWSLLWICSGMISSGKCFSFDNIWGILLITDNSWLSHSYSLEKYIIWTCDLLDISNTNSPLTSSIFYAYLEIKHHPFNVNVLYLCHTLIRKIYALVEYGSGSGCPPEPVS